MDDVNKKPIYGITVDASCLGNPGLMEYRGIDIATGREVFHFGPMYGTNNIGECLAICYALKRWDGLKPIYSDSLTAITWVRQCKHKSTLKRTPETEALFTLLESYLNDVEDITLDNLHKWDTKNWGEIPADFGHKK